MLISAVMIIAKKYTVEWIENTETFRIHNLNAPLCPDCGSLCSGYDTRLRRIIGDDGRATIYRLRRMRCLVCNVLHIELPDSMLPRKHYAAAVIADVLSGRDDNCPAEASTMWRWQRENNPPGLQCVSDKNMVQSTYSDKKEDKNAEEE